MKKLLRQRLVSWVAVTVSLAACVMVSVPAGTMANNKESAPRATGATKPTLDEARSRAALLHDAFHATLATVHHEYYREDEGLTIPAFTLKKVFEELSERHRVELRWLAVNAQAMSVDHRPNDDFDKQAVKALTAGKPFHEATIDGRYRRAAPVKLTSDCLKCHLPNRTSTADRIAALVITQEIAAPKAK